MRHATTQQRHDAEFERWLNEVERLSVLNGPGRVLRDAEFWRDCFNDGMSPDQAIQESLVEQDGM